jgi:nitroreductase
MEFMELAKRRYSVRKYENRPVEQAKIDLILEAGRIAPTAANRQPQRVLVIRSAGGLEKLKKGASVYGAPLVFIVCADHSASWKRDNDGMDAAQIDASIITTHMMLEATNLGLGSLWVCYFKPDAVKAAFNIPDGVEPVNILCTGYAAGEAKSPDRFATERKPLADTVRFEAF